MSPRRPPLPQDIVTFDAEQKIEALPDARLRLDTEVVGEAIVDEYAPGVAHERMNVTHPEVGVQSLAEYQRRVACVANAADTQIIEAQGRLEPRDNALRALEPQAERCLCQ